MSAPTAIWKGPDPVRFPTGVVETPQSGTLKYAERVTYQQEYKGSLANCQSYGGLFPRGAVYTITGFAGTFYVEDTTITSDRGGRGKVAINWVWLGSVPPAEWSVTPFEINPRLERHSYFSALTKDDLSKAYRSFSAPNATFQTAVDAVIETVTNATLVKALLEKWFKGEETFYLAGLKYQWTHYAVSLGGILLRQGGYRETPGGPGFSAGALPPSMAWLRQCDETVWQNGLYRITSSWIGGPSGWWDTDLYGTTPR